MSQIFTLSEFLNASGCQWQVYDLSRRVQPLDKLQFRAVEQGQQAFPSPRQQKAWLAVVFWHALEQPYIWFIALPLDERGGFQQAAMQHFMSIVVEALGSDLTAEPSQEQEKLLEQNPYIFKPEIGKRAAFHAQFTRDFDLPASLHYESAQAFFNTQPDIDWQQLGVQGIHDVVQREAHTSTFQSVILQHYLNWPETLQGTVCDALSHAQVSSTFTQNWLHLLGKQAYAQQLQMLPALASTANSASVQKHLQRLFKSESTESMETLCVLVVARMWPALSHTGLFEQFIARLSELSSATFQALFKEIVVIPELRMSCLQLLHAPQKTPALMRQLVALQQSVRESAQ